MPAAHSSTHGGADDPSIDLLETPLGPAMLPSLAWRRGLDVAGATVGQTPATEVWRENKARLLRYEPLREVESQAAGEPGPAAGPPTEAEPTAAARTRAAARPTASDRQENAPILLVYAVINRPSILDLQPDRSVVRQFLARGFDVYLLDWGEPSRLDAALGFEDYVTRYLADAVATVRERTGHQAIHLFGYCTGATLATMYAALSPETVRTLAFLAPLLSFDTAEGIFARWGTADRISPDLVSGTFGNAPGEFLAAEFAMQDPVEYSLGRYLRLATRLDDRAYVRRTGRRLRWGFETVDVPGRLYEQFLDLYLEDSLMAGDLQLGGERVDLDALEMPILDVLATGDRFVPAAASLPFLERVPSEDTTAIQVPTDHVGLSISALAHESLWPMVCDWYDRR
mgnify:CR=1 FL=1